MYSYVRSGGILNAEQQFNCAEIIVVCLSRTRSNIPTAMVEGKRRSNFQGEIEQAKKVTSDGGN